MPQSPRPGQPSAPIERSGTLIETDEEIRQALSSGTRGQAAVQMTGPQPIEAPVRGTGQGASPFRPTVRPPVPVLTVYDDGRLEGESIRIRDARFVIGRTEGDLRIPIDARISSRHVEITHQLVGGLHRWVVTDLQSTHGMFVRVSRTVLADKAEFLVGNGRYRYEAPVSAAGVTADYIDNDSNTGDTCGWDDGATSFRPPALTELIGREIGNRTLLVKSEYWIGTDLTCPIGRSDDPFCEPRHARVYRGTRGGWYVEHNRTQNGLWLRMSQITLESMIQFQIGEQRFRLKIH